MNRRWLGVDHGNQRIGLAVSDFSGLVARELTVIHRKSRAEDFAAINRIIAQEQVSAIVVGLPINDMAQPGEHTQADTVRLWVERFAATMNLPIVLWEESLTSADARELAIRQKRGSREPIDDLAARLILQSYLDAVRDGLAEPPPSGINEE
ncbi:MAG: Holliday junction resolvase RuvX [Anaerolineae bacterium]|nr:Holliday junction resolvase RuvX [Anaerolineae bacterium]